MARTQRKKIRILDEGVEVTQDVDSLNFLGSSLNVTASQNDVTVDDTTAVVGPASATDGGIVLFSGTTGKLLKNSSNFVQTVAGTVGIGTTSPSSKLQVSGTASSDVGRFDIGVDLNPVISPSAPTSSLLAVVGNVDSGQHYYYVSYYTALGETTLTLSSSTPITADASHGQVQLTIPTSSDYRVIGRRIYRSTAGSAFYNNVKRIATVADNTTTTYTDNIADADLSGTNYFYQENTTSKYITVNNQPAMLLGSNTILGIGAGSSVHGGSAKSNENTIIGGFSAPSLTTGAKNVAIGYQSLQVDTTGDSNVAVGHGAAGSNTTGSANVAIGRNSGYSNKVGSSNLYLGYYAGLGVTNSSNYGNVFTGYYSGYGVTTGNYNTTLGYYAGSSITSGSNNIIIGQNVDIPSPTGSGQLNIGNLLFGTGLYTGWSPSSSPVGGMIGIGTASPAQPLHVIGTIKVGSYTYMTEPNGGLATVFGNNMYKGVTNNTIIRNNTDAGNYINMRYDRGIIFGTGITSTPGTEVADNYNERMRIDNSGNVGIGTTSPTAVLHLKAGGTAAGTAPLKLTTQAAGLTSVEQGTFELIGNSLQFTQLAKRRGVMMSQNVIVSSTTIGNTITESGALLTAEHGANYLEVGKMEELTLTGVIQQTVTGSGTLSIRVKYAGTTILTTTTVAGDIAAGTPFDIKIYTTCRSIGATGTMQINCRFSIDGVLNVPDARALVTIDTTTAQNTTITAQWSVANASNTITVDQGAVECMETNK